MLLISGTFAYGQRATGEVNGTIKDSTGAAVSGALVKLTNTGTGIVDQIQANASGFFVFLNVQPGSYFLTAENPGFKTTRVTFDLAINQTLTQNFTLEVGGLNKTVTVTAQAPLLHT